MTKTKTKKNTVKEHVLKILKAHGPNTDYNFAKNLYLSTFGSPLANQTFYQYRNEYQKEQKKKIPSNCTVKELSSNFLKAAEKEAETPIVVGTGQCKAKDVYTLQELLKVKNLAKEMGGIRHLQEAIAAVKELQE